MLSWIKRSVARQASIVVAGSLSLVALAIWLGGRLDLMPAVPAYEFLIGLFCVVPLAAIVAGSVTQRLVGSRLAHLVDVIDGAGPHDDLARIRDLGADEVGAIGHAVNRLLARLTSIRANMIDQTRQLGEAHRELHLKVELAEKTLELERRLEERSMLFDIIRLTSTSPVLSSLLDALVERVGQMLRMREVVIFLFDEAQGTFSVQATHGFARKDAVRGRSLQLGEGFSGQVGQSRQMLLIDDLSAQPSYQGFWGEAERSGSLASFPILYKDSLLGVLTVTRSEQEPFTELNLRLLHAITDHAALAITNAQLFERMRELSAHDELTGLPNQRHLRSHLEREIDRSRRFDKPFSLLNLEIDQLASEQRDERSVELALCDVTRVLLDSVRKVDTVARVGAQQFAILLPLSDARDAMAVAEKLRRALLGHPFIAPSEQLLRLSASIGVAQLNPSDDEHGTSLVSRSEMGLQVARQQGRNRVASVEPILTPEPPRLERSV